MKADVFLKQNGFSKLGKKIQSVIRELGRFESTAHACMFSMHDNTCMQLRVCTHLQLCCAPAYIIHITITNTKKRWKVQATASRRYQYLGTLARADAVWNTVDESLRL